MDASAQAAYAVLAQAFAYPAPGSLSSLSIGLSAFPQGPARQSYAEFLDRVGRLRIGEWEELYTRTLDLNPPAAPYVGYQTWGESYQRGTFLASMSRALQEAGVETGGELPDHLAPVLNYLARAPQPLPELVEVLDPALDRILRTLRSADPDNPYLSLYQAARMTCQALKKEAA